MKLDYSTKHMLEGLLIFGLLCQGLAKPASDDNFDNEEDVQGDEYQYSDDTENAPGIPDKTTVSSLKPAASPPFFPEKEAHRTAAPGQNVTFACSAKNLAEKNVILWYKGGNVLTTGTNVNDPQHYQLNTSTYDLTVLNVNEGSQADYYCEIQPEGIRRHIRFEISKSTEQKPPQKEEEANEISPPAVAEKSNDTSSSGFAQLSAVLAFAFVTLQLLRI